MLHGLSIGCLVAGGVAVAGAVLAVAFLPAQPPGRAAEDFETQRQDAPVLEDATFVAPVDT